MFLCCKYYDDQDMCEVIVNCRQRLEKFLVRGDDNYDQQGREVFVNRGDNKDDNEVKEVFVLDIVTMTTMAMCE